MRGLGVVAEQGWRGDGLVAQSFAGVRRVRDQFAEEHVLVGIDRVHHQVQQARNVGLEGAAFRLGVDSGGHGGSASPEVATGPQMARKTSKFKIVQQAGHPPAAREAVRSAGVMNRCRPTSYWFSVIFPSCDISHFNI